MAVLAFERTPFRDEAAGVRATTLGMWLLLASLGMLFGATILAYLFIRVDNAGGWPTDLPPLPRTLWLSTLILLASTATMHLALHAARRGRGHLLGTGMVLTFMLGVGFMAVQALGWSSWLQTLVEQWAVRDDVHRLALSSFYVMTGIHAAHVVGGLIPLGVVTRRALAGAYSPRRHGGVLWCAIYWHFLDVVWLLVFATLLLGT